MGSAIMHMPNEGWPKQRSYIGEDVPRLDALKFVTGAATYSADLVPTGCLHVALLRSPHAHATIGAIDVKAALERDGVVAAVSGRDTLRSTHPTPAALPFRGAADGRGPILDRCLAVDKA